MLKLKVLACMFYLITAMNAYAKNFIQDLLGKSVKIIDEYDPYPEFPYSIWVKYLCVIKFEQESAPNGKLFGKYKYTVISQRDSKEILSATGIALLEPTEPGGFHLHLKLPEAWKGEAAVFEYNKPFSTNSLSSYLPFYKKDDAHKEINFESGDAKWFSQKPELMWVDSF